MTRYAKGTDVSATDSRAEIERTLARYGADGFIYGWESERAIVAFRMKGRQVKFLLPLPPKSAERFQFAKGSWGHMQPRAPADAAKAWEQECRERWRALALIIKAKLEAVESGITEFEDEFLAHIVLPNGQTFGTWARPQIALAYERGDMPSLLPAPN